ncbi:MAG: response regulator [Desulfobacteraceae bacterium]|nr:response regulator [Desulfobacteraceae bacterium]
MLAYVWIDSFKYSKGDEKMGKAAMILIADPNPFVRSFLIRELSIAGYKTVAAGSRKEIVDQLNDEISPDLLVMELDFPVSIGLSVLERIQNLVPPVPQIIYTHLTEYKNHPAVQKADDFIEKDEDLRDLLHSISEIIRKV